MDNMSFKVNAFQCVTCIYRPGLGWNIKHLEKQIADKNSKGFFSGYRICHEVKNTCCRGFWNKHKDNFTAGQLAQRLGIVEFIRRD